MLEDPKIADDKRFSSNSRRVSNKASLTCIIDKVFSKLKASDIIERLDCAQIANARLNSVDEFWNHPQLKARKRWKKVDTPKGEVLSLIPPVTMDKVTPVMNPIPSLGSHTERILMELGFTKDFVKQLYKDGAI